MLIRLILACALAALCGAASSAQPEPAPTILVFGDSLAAGYGIPQASGWASLLEKRLREEGFAYRVANASVSGETTDGGLRRIDGALRTHRPELVVIELGANDGLRGSNLEVMRHNLEAIVEASRRAKAQVMLVGMRLPPNYGTAYTEKFHQVYADVARAKRTALVPFLFEGFAEEARYFQPDRVHPTGEAQSMMLDTVWKGLKPLLRK